MSSTIALVVADEPPAAAMDLVFSRSADCCNPWSEAQGVDYRVNAGSVVCLDMIVLEV